MSPRDQQKVAKLLALALDNRGSEKEAAAAGAKALCICRQAGLTVEELALILPIPQPPEAAEEIPTEPITPFERAAAKAAERFVNRVLKRAFAL